MHNQYQTAEPSYMKQRWDAALAATKILPAVRASDTLSYALKSAAQIVYLLFGTPMNIAEMIASIHAQGKLSLVNLDLLQGFSRDAYAVESLAGSGADGIISTHTEPLRAARSRGLITVLRTFIIDSAAVAASHRSLDRFQPDALEVLPAVAAPVALDQIRERHPALPVIAGGLVRDLKQAEQLIATGINAVSLSNPKYWTASRIS